MRCLNATFYALLSERGHGQNAGKKAAECYRNFGFNSPSRQLFSLL